ncbi:MAG: DNA mismatch repair endonuclease MutL [Candidatus Aminicenantes bacterium]|nr:DNA mismatch repair endonuclease MutL [Candidatus Aminicenantes bacterium]
MGKIKELEAEVFRKIAAGEVVERPLSAVKELVENSIDAGAGEIKVEVRDGGKRFIKVTDNGDGFEPDDIEKAFKRHSTSKLNRLEDFNSLDTLGFRGEALPSILEVSKILLKTSSNTEGKGTFCTFEEGKLVEREEIAFNKGAAIEIQDLFYNFPVRKKFLKSERSELNQVIAFLEQTALSNFHIAFSLSNNDRLIFFYNKAATLKERIYQVFGKEFLDGLQEVNFEYGQYKLNGFISKINTGVAVKKYQHFFVNKRPIRERTLFAALNNTFRRFLEKSKNPVGILSLEVPPREIDVNVHPMKLEIKFEDSSAIYQLVKRGIESTFGSSGGAAADRSLDFLYRDKSSPEQPPDAFTASPGQTAPGPGFAQAQLFSGEIAHIEEGFYLIGQYLNSYILVEKEGALLVVDQHNADERVNFDHLKKEYRENKVVSITPLFPIIIELTHSEVSRLDERKQEMLSKVGFDLRPLSGNSYDVKSFPQVLDERSIKDAVLTILHLQQGDVDFEDKVLAEVACKSAIKVNHRLSPEKMRSIVKDLFRSTNAYFCPHKRPIIVEFGREQIEKLLKRK